MLASRSLSLSELDHLHILLLTIGRITISLIHADRVVWRASSNKRFSVHNLYNKVIHNIASHDQIIMPDVWLNLSQLKLNFSYGLRYLINCQQEIIFSLLD